MRGIEFRIGCLGLVVIIVVVAVLLPILWHLAVLLISLAAIAVLVFAGLLLWGYLKLRKFRKQMERDGFDNFGSYVDEEVFETTVKHKDKEE